jgi:hypothetical protein
MKLKLILTFLILAMSYNSPAAYSYLEVSQDKGFPPGEWTLQHPVISRLGLKDAPLQIISVKAEGKRGGTIRTVRLKNNSGKEVTAVKFVWYLFQEQETKNILQKGETPILGLDNFADRTSKAIDYPIVSFGNIYKPLVKDGKLIGDFVLEVAVGEIIYEDGSKWERK